MNDAGPSIRIDWDDCRRADWDRLAARAPFCPFEQSWLYGDAYAGRSVDSIRRAVIRDADTPVAIAQIFRRRFGGLVTLAQILRGPVLLDPALPSDRLAALFQKLKAEYRDGGRQILFWTPELPDGDDAIALLRGCRLRQVMTGYGSARIDLQRAEDELRAALHGKWRNALVTAETGPLRTETTSGGIAVLWLLERYGAQRRQQRFGGPSPVMLVHILGRATPRDVVLMRALKDNEPVAGALFLRHGRAATYLVGWSDDAGRAAGAGTLLLWRGMLTLRERGVEILDLGGIDTRREPGIARFKLGAGGTPYRLAGTFA